MIQLNIRSISYAAIAALGSLSAINFSAPSYGEAAPIVQQIAPDDAPQTQWVQVALNGDIAYDYDRDALEAKLILHGHLPMRGRASIPLCIFPIHHYKEKQEKIMSTYAKSVAAPAAPRNILNAILTNEGGQ